MAHKFVKWGMFLFFVLSVSVLVTQTDDFFENITGNVVLSEEVAEETEEVIVVLKEPDEEGIVAMGEKSEEELEEVLEVIREEIIDDLSVNDTANLTSGGFVAEVNESVLEDLEEDPRVAFVEPVRYFDVSLSEATTILNASDVWTMNVSGQNLTGLYETVCVIDTGINYSHVDLVGRNVTACNLDCIDQLCVENCSETDLNGHGTHVAGIAVASGVVTGVARGANYIGMKVFPDDLQSGATTTGIKNAIDWCVDNSSNYNISVITLSLGTSILYDDFCDSDYPSFNTSITNAYNKNISVTVSSGNDANTTHISSPACVSKAIPVADTYDANVGSVGWGSPLTCTDSTTALDQIVCHANFNSLVRLLAPGALINSTWYDGTYSETGGTSMSAPMVAGTIAVMNQFLDIAVKNETPATLEDWLFYSGQNISSGSNNFSRINLFDAIQFMEVGVVLDSPENGNVTFVNETFTHDRNFTCNSSSIYNLTNVTFNLWNSTGDLTHNESLNITGFGNSSVFNYTFSQNDTYVWNCLVFNNNTNSSWAKNNFTLTINNTNITVEVIEAEDDPVVENTGGGGGGGGSTVTTKPKVPVVEEDETDVPDEEPVNDSDVPDEEVAEFFTQDEEPETGDFLFEVLTSSGSVIVVVLVIFGVVTVLHRMGIIRKAKKLKRSKTKE
jgi:hypothetical protein